MEKEIVSIKKNILTNDFTKNEILRCPNCNLICSLKIEFKKDGPIINYECENGHNGSILLKDFKIEYNKFSFLKQKCEECGKKQEEIKKDFVYCLNCVKFLCNNCKMNHTDSNNHNLINYQKCDSLCKIHSNTFSWYCSNCKKNLCIYCKKEHKNHSLIDLSEFNFSKESFNALEIEIKDLQQKVNNLDIFKEKIISLINQNKESIELEIQFLTNLFETYKYEEKQKNLNYYIINNLKKISTSLNYDKIFIEGDKFITFLENFQPLNYMKNNFKTLNENTSKIYYLDILKDGRLVSCSSDNTFNIYKKDTFEIELSIKEYSKPIYSFTQLNDGRIIYCSSNKTMKIIKLIEGEKIKYEIEQILYGHKNEVFKVIEIGDNKLVSISSDKTMKIWILNNENKFQCISTIAYQNNYSNGNILKINNKEFVTISCEDRYLKFWNINDYSLINKIDNIYTTWSLKSLCLLEDDILCVGGRELKGFYIIKISTHQIIKNISELVTVWSMNKYLNNWLLCSIYDGKNNSLVLYKYKNKNIVKMFEKIDAHFKAIYSCVEINDKIIASGGEDHLIKLWKN